MQPDPPMEEAIAKMSTTAVPQARDRPMLAVGANAGAWPPLGSHKARTGVRCQLTRRGSVAQAFRRGAGAPAIKVVLSQRPCT